MRGRPSVRPYRRLPVKRRRRKDRSGRWGIVIAVLLVLAGTVSLLIYFGVLDVSWFSAKKPAAADASTSVRFIDVGQGDCTLALSEGKAMLIDTGESDGSDGVIAYLRALGIKRLECMVITHPHSDHMGEAADIIAAFEVGKVIMPELPAELIPTGYSYEKLLRAIDRYGIPLEAASAGSFKVGEIGAEIFMPRELSDDLNDCSAVVKLTHGGNSFLITGDCGKSEEKQLIAQGCSLSADVLKVGHHGSTSASSEIFLAAVRPGYAVISCGADNDYGHPHEQTLMRLRAFTKNIYITRDCGTVTFVSDGSGLTVSTGR